MIVMSHRGFWREPDEKNALSAFDHTVAEGFGTETDVRDRDGVLVVSHDPATPHSPLWSEVLNRFDGTGLPLAVNVKADGLSKLLAEAFSDRDIDWFAFDMSGPETIRFAKAGLPFYTRHSDIEPSPILYKEAAGVWLDAFETDWITAGVITQHLEAGKSVCVVSPELHGRDPDILWERLLPLTHHSRLILCTDRPDLAKDRLKL